MPDWDEFSLRYDEIFTESPFYRDTLDTIVERMGSADGARVLDLGCGTGNTMARILQEFPDAVFFGVDPSAEMREKCQAKFAGRTAVTVVDGSALRIPFPDDGFDFLVSNLALHHVPPERRHDCCGELARVLKRGGRLLYADMFCGVEGPPEDPERCRDIINKMVGAALYCLDHGAYDMMMVTLETLPADLRADGEYLTTQEVWAGLLEDRGFRDIDFAPVYPEEFGIAVLCAALE